MAALASAAAVVGKTLATNKAVDVVQELVKAFAPMTPSAAHKIQQMQTKLMLRLQCIQSAVDLMDHGGEEARSDPSVVGVYAAVSLLKSALEEVESACVQLTHPDRTGIGPEELETKLESITNKLDETMPFITVGMQLAAGGARQRKHRHGATSTSLPQQAAPAAEQAVPLSQWPIEHPQPVAAHTSSEDQVALLLAARWLHHRGPALRLPHLQWRLLGREPVAGRGLHVAVQGVTRGQLMLHGAGEKNAGGAGQMRVLTSDVRALWWQPTADQPELVLEYHAENGGAVAEAQRPAVSLSRLSVHTAPESGASEPSPPPQPHLRHRGTAGTADKHDPAANLPGPIQLQLLRRVIQLARAEYDSGMSHAEVDVRRLEQYLSAGRLDRV